jgi:hypothetical protein
LGGYTATPGTRQDRVLLQRNSPERPLAGAAVRAPDEPSHHNVRGRDHDDDERGA